MYKKYFISLFFCLSAAFFATPEARSEDIEDYIPGFRKFEILKNFVTDHVSKTDDGVTADGTFRDRHIRVTQTTGKEEKSFSVEVVEGTLSISDFIPDLSGFPGESVFRLQEVEFDEKKGIVTSIVAVGNARISIELDPKGLIASVSTQLPGNPDLSLGGIVQDLDKVPVVRNFVVESMSLRAKEKSIATTGRVNAIEATLTISLNKGLKYPVADLDFGGGVTLPRVFPDLRDLPAIDGITLENLHYDHQTRAVNGEAMIGNIDAVLALDTSKGVKSPVIDLKFVSGLALPKVLPEIAGVPLVGDFVLDDLRYDRRTRTVSGAGSFSKIKATLALDTQKGIKRPVVDLSFPNGVTLPQILPQVSDIPVVGDVTLDDLRYDHQTRTISGNGVAGKIQTVLSLDTGKGITNPVVDLKFPKGVTLPQVLPQVGGAPVVGDVALDDLRYDHRTRTVSGSGAIRQLQTVIALDTSKGVKNPVVSLKFPSGVTLPKVLPEVSGVPVVGDFAFDGVSFDKQKNTAQAVGDIHGKTVSLDIKIIGEKVFDLKADKEIGLGDVLSELGDLPGVGGFGIRELSLKGKTIAADVAFGEATAKLSIDLNVPSGGGSRFAAFNIVPDANDLSIGRLFPDLSSIPGLDDFRLTGLNFVEKTRSLVASIGSGSKSAKVSTAPSKSKGQGRLFKLSSPHLSIGDIVPSLSHIPMFNALKFDEIDIAGTTIETTLDIGSASVKLFASLKDEFAALDFGGLGVSSIIPAAADTVLKNAKLAGSLFVVSKNPNATPGNLPADMLKSLGAIDVKTPFKQGVTMLGNLRKEDLGPKLSGLFDKLSIKSPSFPVSGIFPSEIFDFLHQAKDQAKDAKKEVVTAILDALDLSIDIPVPEIDALKKFATFKTAHLSITGNSGDDPFWKNLPADMRKRKPTGRLDVSVRGGITLNLGGFDGKSKTPIELDSLIDLNAGEAAKSVSLLGRVDGAWDKPFGIKGLTFEKSGFDIALTTESSSAKATLDFFSVAKLHDKTDLSVDAAFSESGGLPKLDYFVLDGPLALTDLAGDLPNASNFIVHEIKLYPDGIEAQVEAKNKLLDERTNLYLFELDTPTGKALVAAIDLAFSAKTHGKQNFSLGRLAKIAGLRGSSAKTIQTNLDAMAVANAALILSTKQVYPLTPDALKNGIASDLFGGIFGKSNIPVKLDNVTFLSDFRANLMGEIGDKLVHGVNGIKLGLSEDAVINGSVGGLFDSDPLSLDLEFLMAESLSLDNLQKSGLKLPPFLKAKPTKAGGAGKVGLFLKVVDTTFEAGLLAGFDLEYNKTAFDFTGTLGVQLAEEEVGLSLSGAMNDTWKNALGIQGFELESVTVSGEIEADPPSIKIGLGGDANLWDHDMSTSGDIIVGLAGEVPVPEGLGVKTTVSNLDVTMYEILNTATLLSSAEFVIDPPMWPIIIVGVVGEVGLSEGYTIIYDKTHGKKVSAGDLAKAPVKDAGLLIKDYSKLQAWILGGKDIYLSFATPGASDANLGIPDGIHFSGKVELFGGALKSPSIRPNIGWIYKVAQSLNTGTQKVKHTATEGKDKAKAFTQAEFTDFKNKVSLLRDIIAKEAGLTKKTIATDYPKPSAKELKEFLDSLSFTQSKAFRLGGLEFTDNHISLVPFRVRSKAKLFGNSEDIELSMKGGKLVLETTSRIEVLGDTKLMLEFDLEKQDFIVVGEYAGSPSLRNWLSKEIQTGIKQISGTATSKLAALDKDLDDARKLRDGAENELEIAQKAASEVTQAAIDRLRQTTSGYEQEYEHANNEYNGCHGWKKYYCRTKWWPRKSLAWDTWQASKQLLADAEKALSEAKSLAVEVHKAEIKVNAAATKVALAAKDVEAATDIKSIVAKGLDAFANDAGRMATLFRLDKAFIGGSVKDLLTGKPLVTELQFEINGKKYVEFFALSPTDADFNALSFGLLPVIAAEHVVQDMEKSLENELRSSLGDVGNLSGKLTTWISAHIYELIGGMRDNLEKRIADIEYELSQEESRYKKIFDSLDAHAGNYLDGYKNLTDESNRILSTYKMTDFMPASFTFQNRYVAVGHSALCLGVASNGIDVYQENCKDMDAERWTAEPADNTQQGYILLKSKGLCLQAQNMDTNSGQPLVLAQCSGNNDHEKWKFLSQDGVFSKFVNRYSQKCLHFDTVNANEKAGYAVWTSCFGADSQGFRVIGDAEKPEFHKVEKMLKARNGACVTVDPDFEKYFTKTAKGYTTATRNQLIGMRRSMDNSLLAGTCADDGKSRFNYVEGINGDLKLVHEQSGWCVVPGPGRDGSVVLMPCDNGTDMYWKAREYGESAFVLRNNQTGTCLDLGARSGRAGGARPAGVASCQTRPDQILEFVRN